MILSTYKKEVNGRSVDWPKAHIKLSDFLLCGRAPGTQQEVSDDNKLAQTT